ncbi:MAG: cystathionine gamma-synthase [Microbacteriaceae bacterium]
MTQAEKGHEDTGFATRAIHAGQSFDERTGAAIPPVYLTSTYVQHGVADPRDGFEYSRIDNPNRRNLEQQLASLEGGAFAFSFASGMAAEDAILRTVLRPGDHVIIGKDVYGGAFRLIDSILKLWGIEHSVVDQLDFAAVEAAIQPNTKIVRIETPSNPLLEILDISRLSEIAKAHRVLTLVDNTFASPALQNPLQLGADIVVHSTTKYINGHSDVVGGAVILNDAELAEALKFLQSSIGAVSAPFDAWLTSRGIRTLALRMRQHSENAQILAERLVQHPAVEAVHYPGLPEHPGHELARSQMSGFGGMLSVQIRGGAEETYRFVQATRLFVLATSLGGTESLISYPSEMTHAALKGTPQAVPVNLARLSIGLEDVEDLWADLEKALALAIH